MMLIYLGTQKGVYMYNPNGSTFDLKTVNDFRIPDWFLMELIQL